MPITDTYSSVLHRIDQAVRWRAVHPNDPIPPPYDILVKYTNPPEELVNKSKRRLEKLIAAADVKKGKKYPTTALIDTNCLKHSSTQSPIPQTSSRRSSPHLRDQHRRSPRPQTKSSQDHRLQRSHPVLPEGTRQRRKPSRHPRSCRRSKQNRRAAYHRLLWREPLWESDRGNEGYKRGDD